jgi:GWxTD domain-containing protein
VRANLTATTVLLLIASAAIGEESIDRDFGTGPAQWIMTAEERKAWRSVKTDEEAKNFAELFWVRRDPTPGTFANEFRDEFDARVRYADLHFKEPLKRGALTDRGRVLVALGFPSNMDADTAKSSLANQDANLGSAGGHGSAARDVWKYEPKQAQQYGMIRIEVVFIHDGVRGQVRRDPGRQDFMSALPTAIKLAIRNPEISEVPDWAKFEKQFIESGGQAPPPVASVVEAPTPLPNTATAPPVARELTYKPAGAGRLTLLKDAWAMQPQNGTDPFVTLQSQASFKKGEELGWAFEYCLGGAGEPPAVTVGMVIKGGGATFRGELDDLVPDSIRSSPGCHVVRGSVPLSEFEPGDYEITLTLRSYNLKRTFRVE